MQTRIAPTKSDTERTELISHTTRATLIARRAALIPHTIHIDTKQAKRRGKTRGNQPSLRSLFTCKSAVHRGGAPPRRPFPPCETNHLRS